MAIKITLIRIIINLIFICTVTNFHKKVIDAVNNEYYKETLYF